MFSTLIRNVPSGFPPSLSIPRVPRRRFTTLPRRETTLLSGTRRAFGTRRQCQRVCAFAGALLSPALAARESIPPASSWLVIWVPDIVKSVCFPMVFATFQVTLPDGCPRRLSQIPNGTTAPAVVLHVQALSGFEVASLQRGGSRSLAPA